MTTVYVALGANVGNKEKNIKEAIALLGEKIINIRVAPIYTTKPFGVTHQPNFLNTALVGDTELSPQELLVFAKEIEKKVGRTARFHWGPREIDIDIIFYGEEIYQDVALTIPHALVQERDFVLQPIADLNSDLIDPHTKKTVSNLLAALPRKDRSIIN